MEGDDPVRPGARRPPLIDADADIAAAARSVLSTPPDRQPRNTRPPYTTVSEK
jgi:hypothetical protein